LDDLKSVGAAVVTGGASLAVDEHGRDMAKDAGRAIGSAFEQGWDSFEASIKQQLKSLHVNSVKDGLWLLKSIATGGAAPLADAGVAALNDFLFSKLTPYARDIAEAIGKFFGDGHQAVSNMAKSVQHYLDGKGWPPVLTRLIYEFLTVNGDLLMGYPQCVCEQGCIGIVSKQLKDSGGIPGIIGNILWYLWPIVQGRPSEDVKVNYPWTAPCMFYYAHGGQLLINAKMDPGTQKILGQIIGEASSEQGKNFAAGMPQSYEAYKKYLIDEVARGEKGPEAMGGRQRTAKWYFEHPDVAAQVLSNAGFLERTIDRVRKYVGWIDTALEIGKGIYDVYQAAQSFEGMDLQALDFDAVMELAGRFVDKARGTELGLSTVDRYAKRLESSIGVKEIADAYRQVAQVAKQKAQTKKFKASVPRINQPAAQAAVKSATTAITASKLFSVTSSLRGFGAIGAYDTQDFLAEWQPAEIGLAARERWNTMAYAWCSMTEAERAAMRLDGKDGKKNQQVWASTGVDYARWHEHLSNSKEVEQLNYNLNLPLYYADWLGQALAMVKLATPITTQAWRAGTSLPPIANVGKWQFVIPDTLFPSPRDIGWPLHKPRAAGVSATPEQYALWLSDLLDIYDPRRWKGAYERAKARWNMSTKTVQDRMLKDTPSGPGNPAVSLTPVLRRTVDVKAKLRGVAVSLPVFIPQRLTSTSFWATVMVATGQTGYMQVAPTVPAGFVSSLNNIMTVVAESVATIRDQTSKRVADANLHDPTVGAGGSTSSNWGWWVAGGVAAVVLLRWRLAAE
jgi:hypothetical protein